MDNLGIYNNLREKEREMLVCIGIIKREFDMVLRI